MFRLIPKIPNITKIVKKLLKGKKLTPKERVGTTVSISEGFKSGDNPAPGERERPVRIVEDPIQRHGEEARPKKPL